MNPASSFPTSSARRTSHIHRSQWVLGLHVGPDAAAVLCHQRELVSGAYEAQFDATGAESHLPVSAIRWVLQSQGLSLADLDAIVLPGQYTTGWSQLCSSAARLSIGHWPAAAERMAHVALMQRVSARSLAQLLSAHGPWTTEELLPPLVYCPAELSYIALGISSATSKSGAYVFVGGEREAPGLRVGTYQPGSIQQLRSAEGPSTLGRFIASVLAYLGITSAASLRSLAAFSGPDSERVSQLALILREQMLTCHRDGSLSLSPAFFSGSGYRRSAWSAAIGVLPRTPTQACSLEHAYFARAALDLISERISALADYARRLTERDTLLLAGPLLEYVPTIEPTVEPLVPANGWAQAAGAALAYSRILTGDARELPASAPRVPSPVAGPVLLDTAVESLASRSGHECIRYASPDALYRAVALQVSGGESLAWCDTRAHTTQLPELVSAVLLDPRRAEAMIALSARLGRPTLSESFTALLRVERASEFFELTQSPVGALFRAPLQHRWRKRKPSDWLSLDFAQRAATSLSNWPAVVGPDYHAQLLLISADMHPELWALLLAFERVADCPMLAVASLHRASSDPLSSSLLPYTPSASLRAAQALHIHRLLVGSLFIRLRPASESLTSSIRA